MKKIIKTLFYLFCISTLSFAEEEIENTRDRGIDKMNFYIPVNKQNKYSNFTELDLRKDKNIEIKIVEKFIENKNKSRER